MWILEAPPRVVMVGSLRKRHAAVGTDASVEYPKCCGQWIQTLRILRRAHSSGDSAGVVPTG
eukprot:381910-Amphidinium_carterae.1